MKTEIHIGYDSDTFYISINGKEFSNRFEEIGDMAEFLAEILKNLGYGVKVQECY